MSNDTLQGVVAGAIVSIPLGTLSGFMVLWLPKWIENRGKTKAAVHERQIRDRYNECLYYCVHPHLFTQFLLHTVILTTLAGAALAILSSLLFALAGLVRFEIRIPGQWGVRLPYYLRGDQILVAVGQLIAIVTSILIIRYCVPAISTWRIVKDFKSYAQTVPVAIRDQALEARADI